MGLEGLVDEEADADLDIFGLLLQPVPFVLDGAEGAVLCALSLIPEGEGDLPALPLFGDVADNAEEVSGIGALGE